MFLSFVVPVYNAAQYLPECLDSLLAQDISDYEIICVNDGSRDASPEILGQYAAEHGFDYFCSTLSISPMKNAAKLNEIGAELSGIYPVKLLPSDFKKKGGYLRSIELSREYGLYRQNYCGCVFSKQEAQRRENEKTN